MCVLLFFAALGSLLGPLGVLLGSSWGLLGASWAPLGGLLGPLGRLLGPLGGVLAPLGGLLGASWGLLGASWAHLGLKTASDHLFGPQLGSQNQRKIEKNRCQKSICFETRFLYRFSSILHRFWTLKTIIFGPNLAIKSKMSIS